MKKLLSASAAIALATLGLSAAPASATTPAASYDYSMDGAFTDSVGTSTLTPAPTCDSPAADALCNVTTNFGTDVNGHYWHWVTTQDNGGGAYLDTSARLGSTYSLYLKFAIETPANDVNGSDCTSPDDNYSKLLDFRDQASDVGLYTSGCDPLYVSTGYDTGTATVPLDQVVEIVLSRDDSTGEVTVFINYANGYEESFVTDDSNGDFIPADSGSGSRIRLFQEDGTDSTHEGIKAGRLYGMKAFADTALTIDQLDGLVTVPAALANTGVDASQTNAIAGFGALALVAGVAVVARRRRA